MLAIRDIPRFRPLRRGPIALVAAGLTMLACLHASTPVSAQPYTELSQFKDSPEYAKKKSEMFAAGTTDDDGKKLFELHYTFRIAEMTVAANYNKLANKREELKKKDLAPLGKLANPELHDRLTTFLVTNLPKWCADNKYHPAVRVNWTLILGDLNAKEPELNGKGDVPLPEALPKLQEIYTDETQHTAVRLAALVGIARHVAKPNMPAETRKRLAQAMTAIVAKKKPKEFSQDAHEFLRRRSLDALRAILDTTPEAGDAAVAAALADLTADTNVKLHYRCEAAAALGTLEGRSFNKENVPDLARKLADLAVEITKPEAPPAAAAPATVPPVAAPSAAVPPAAVPTPDAAPGAPLAAKPPVVANNANRPNASRARELQAYFLACVRQGFKGSKANRGLVSVGVEPDTKKLVDELLAKVEEMLRLVTDKKNVADADLASQLLPVNEGLQAMLKAMATTKAGAEAGSPPVLVSEKK